MKAGDLVWAWDEETGDVALKRVVETYVRETDELIHLSVNGEEIATTPTHPFYAPTKGWTAAAVYEYQADCDGEWGEIQFDFESGTAKIVRLADWDTTVTNIFAKKTIEFLLGCGTEKLPKETMIAFERRE